MKKSHDSDDSDDEEGGNKNKNSKTNALNKAIRGGVNYG
jgi:hypothetical protein